MKHSLSIAVLLLAASSPAWAQFVSSHAPAVVVSQSGNTAFSQPVGRPVARVNGAVLTDLDLLREEYTIFPYAKQHNGIPKAMEADIRAGAMQMIVFEELVYQEAERRKLTVSPQRLQRAKAEFRKQFTTPQEYDNLLNTEFKGSAKLLDTKIERSLLIEKMLKIEVENRSVVSVAEAKAFYDKNGERFRVPESFSVQTISVMPPSSAPAGEIKHARNKAEDALRQAKATKTHDEFGMLAQKISEDDYRVLMGDHGPVDKAKFPPQVLQAVVKMQPGQVSDLIDIGNNGYTIVRLNEHSVAGMRTFEEVRDSVREYLRKQKTEQLRRSLDARLRKNAKVEEL